MGLDRFDEPTVQWCFARLAASSARADDGWLHRRRDEWTDSKRSWSHYVRAWAQHEGLHTGQEMLRELDTRDDRQSFTQQSYFFSPTSPISASQTNSPPSRPD